MFPVTKENHSVKHYFYSGFLTHYITLSKLSKGTSSTLLKASSLLLWIFLQLIGFVPLKLKKKFNMRQCSGMSYCVFKRKGGEWRIHAGTPRKVRAFGSSMCLWLCVFSNCQEAQFRFVSFAVCQHIGRFHGSEEAGDCLPYAIWIWSPWVGRKP